MNSYSITIEVNDATPLAGDDVDRITGELEEFAPALSNSARGFRSATITAPGASLRQATASAVAVVEAAFGAEAIVCEVMTEDEFDVRQGWVAVPELVSVSEAAALLGVTRQRVQQRINEHTLPATRVGSGYVLPRAAVEASFAQGDV
jgi:excisionase family DNA binding protein